ncbi:hypothetical protein BGZ79_006999 [Entomortierella chlamydospora]|nr:hypothetical protein BGZ79_006999 [Entomortierella chlamydospora]
MGCAGDVLASGKTIVGPHSTFFKSHSKSHIWLNLERQTRTNFDDEITYGKHAAVHTRPLRYNIKSATQVNLRSFRKPSNGWQRLKLTASAFNKLYSGSGVVLTKGVEERIAAMRCDKEDDDADADDDRGIYNHFQNMPNDRFK